MKATVVDQTAVAEADKPEVEPNRSVADGSTGARSAEFDSLLRAPVSSRSTCNDQEAATAESPGALTADTPPVVEAEVDGKRVRIVAQEEIVLECGSASITLRRNGRIVIRGTYIETCAEGTNRIKGGQVRIN